MDLPFELLHTREPLSLSVAQIVIQSGPSNNNQYPLPVLWNRFRF